MTIPEVQRTLEKMTIILDSREHLNINLSARLEQMGVPYVRKALSFGDYSAVFTMPNGELFSLENKCVIERKQNLTEICGNFCQNRKRFEREFDRVKEAGARVYLLIENASWQKVFKHEYRSKMSPQALEASLLAWSARYDCKIIMCEANISGILIRDILFREAKERLLKLCE